jgi:hypothetical protein
VSSTRRENADKIAGLGEMTRGPEVGESACPGMRADAEFAMPAMR